MQQVNYSVYPPSPSSSSISGVRDRLKDTSLRVASYKEN